MGINPVYLIVGLGNPGPEYERHRHNAGFMVAEEFRRRRNLPYFHERFRGLVSEGEVEGKMVVLLLPMTFMNHSGRAAGEAAHYYGVPVERILVIHDDVELPFGEVRLKEGQGLGGHNGLRSLEQALGSRDFWRVRIGVGRPERGERLLVDHVLAPFSEPEEAVRLLIEQGADLVDEWLATRDDVLCPV